MALKLKKKRPLVSASKQEVASAFTRQFAKHPKTFTILSIVGFLSLLVLCIPIIYLGWVMSFFGLIPGFGDFYYPTAGETLSAFERLCGADVPGGLGVWPYFPMFQSRGTANEWLFVIIGTVILFGVIIGFAYLAYTILKAIIYAYRDLAAAQAEDSKLVDEAVNKVLHDIADSKGEIPVKAAEPKAVSDAPVVPAPVPQTVDADDSVTTVPSAPKNSGASGKRGMADEADMTQVSNDELNEYMKEVTKDPSLSWPDFIAKKKTEKK